MYGFLYNKNTTASSFPDTAMVKADSLEFKQNRIGLTISGAGFLVFSVFLGMFVLAWIVFFDVNALDPTLLEARQQSTQAIRTFCYIFIAVCVLACLFNCAAIPAIPLLVVAFLIPMAVFPVVFATGLIVRTLALDKAIKSKEPVDLKNVIQANRALATSVSIGLIIVAGVLFLTYKNQRNQAILERALLISNK